MSHTDGRRIMDRLITMIKRDREAMDEAKASGEVQRASYLWTVIQATESALYAVADELDELEYVDEILHRRG